jgi:hypothetical protein
MRRESSKLATVSLNQNDNVMKRISKELKAIADAHIEARKTGNFNPKEFNRSKKALIQNMKDGHTYEALIDQIEISFCSVTTLIIGAVLGAESKAYKAGIYKGFKHYFGDAI